MYIYIKQEHFRGQFQPGTGNQKLGVNEKQGRHWKTETSGHPTLECSPSCERQNAFTNEPPGSDAGNHFS